MLGHDDPVGHAHRIVFNIASSAGDAKSSLCGPDWDAVADYARSMENSAKALFNVAHGQRLAEVEAPEMHELG